jgi:hypothetical protein
MTEFTDTAVTTPELTRQVTRGVCRYLSELGFSVLTEFTLKNGRRADVIGLADDGSVVIVEVKTSVADLKADQKWPEYEEFCDQLYFAVPRDFALDLLPSECGVLVADSWGADEIRAANVVPLHASRRRVLTLKFARTAAQRLHDLTDPRIG